MLELTRVDKAFAAPREVRVLSAASLVVHPGAIACVTGPVASGKTTLIRLLAGDLFADAGQVKVLGHDVAKLRQSSLRALRTRVAWIPQDMRLLADRSSIDNVAVAARIAGAVGSAARGRAAELLGELGLGDVCDAPVRQLSAGQRRRVSIARALALDPQIILADEPTADVDLESVGELGRIFAELAGSGTTVLVASHDPRVLDMARARGWERHHLRLGEISPVETREDDVVSGVIVPFPRRARAGAQD